MDTSQDQLITELASNGHVDGMLLLHMVAWTCRLSWDCLVHCRWALHMHNNSSVGGALCTPQRFISALLHGPVTLRQGRIVYFSQSPAKARARAGAIGLGMGMCMGTYWKTCCC